MRHLWNRCVRWLGDFIEAQFFAYDEWRIAREKRKRNALDSRPT